MKCHEVWLPRRMEAGTSLYTPRDMYRPCFLVVDREFPGSISTRKLVLETAKYNVLTAYSSDEAVTMLSRFPNVDAIVMDALEENSRCRSLVEQLRAVAPGIRIVLTSGRSHIDCGAVDLHLDNYNPRVLLDALTDIFPSMESNANYEDEQGRRVKNRLLDQ